GYGRFYRSLKAQLVAKFGDRISLTATADRGTTGRFEVVLRNTGELLHSKKRRGQGRCEDPREVEALIEQIQNFLDSASA
ncbi:unnamed protein product, partial [Ascophyllum nodosum]